MNTIIAIVWARDWAVVSFTDVENIYTLSLGGVTTLRSLPALSTITVLTVLRADWR